MMLQLPSQEGEPLQKAAGHRGPDADDEWDDDDEQKSGSLSCQSHEIMRSVR